MGRKTLGLGVYCASLKVIDTRRSRRFYVLLLGRCWFLVRLDALLLNAYKPPVFVRRGLRETGRIVYQQERP